MEIWKDIENIINKSENSICLRKFNDDKNLTYKELGINEESVLGQILKNMSIIIINGYLRVLGGDYIIPFNQKVKEFYSGNKLIVANDIFGGLYAIGNGDFEGDIRNIWYFAPDLLEWENLEINYPQFIAWVCSKNIKEFYDRFIWKDINLIINNLKENQMVLIYPFLWSTECNVETADKTIIPIEELTALNANYRKKLLTNLNNCEKGKRND